MAASKANIGYGAIFYTGESASPTGYTAVSEITEIDGVDLTVPVEDVTHLLSPNTTGEKIPTINEPGTLSLKGNFLGDTSQLNFTTLAQAQTVFPWKLTSTVQRTKVMTRTGLGFVTKVHVGPINVRGKIQFDADIQLTGAITTTVV